MYVREMSDQPVTREIPQQLKKLVRLIARGYYQPTQIAVLDILSMYPCVREEDLIEVLKFDQKQLRQALVFLKKDKLIKSLQKMETDGGEVEKTHLAHYYYINYKQFVNAVKYKLDQMRKKIEMEEKRVQNRTSYQCPGCQSTFSDLDVDRIIDHVDGSLKCLHCKTELHEDKPAVQNIDSRAVIVKLNSQMKPIMELLKEAETINLAPELLEPEAQSIQKHLHAKGYKSSMSKEQWTSRKAVDLYGGDQAVRVTIGAAEHLKETVAKERPEWMKYSTVHPDNVTPDVPEPLAMEETLSPSKPSTSDHQILAELLAHEVKTSQPPVAHQQVRAKYSSGSSSDEEEVNKEVGAEQNDSEEEEDFKIKIGDRWVLLNEVTGEMVAKMTQEEKETYTRLCQQAVDEYEYL